MVLSLDPEAMTGSMGEKTTSLTVALWPGRKYSSCFFFF